MMFDLPAPCGNCPFRTDKPDLKGWLGAERAAEIVGSLLADKTFPCHKTVDYSDEDDDGHPCINRDTSEEQHCAGALILLERLNRPNQMMRIAERLRMYDHTKLKMDSPVVETPEEFIKLHEH